MSDSAHAFIDPDGVRAAGAALSGAPAAAAAPPPAVTPCAADSTSVGVASALTSSITELINATMALNDKTAHAAGRLDQNAITYEEQEQANAASLASASRGSAQATPVLAGPTSGHAPTLAPVAPASGGVQPTSGREIAALLHGGPGPEALECAATALNTHAAQLESAAQTVRSARWSSEQSWDSAASARATTHLASLESTYTRHADQSRALSRDAAAQANNFRQARANTPTPEQFADLEQRLRAAAAANAQSGGRYTAMVTKLQTDLAAAHQQAVSSYTTYTNGSKLDAKPLGPNVASTATGGLGEAGASGPGSPKEASGEAPPGAGDPATAGLDGAAAGDPSGGDLMQTLLPTIFGVVAGAAGGLLGALSGAAEKVQQTGTQLVSGLAQGGASALQGMSAGEPEMGDLSSGEGGGPDDLGLGDGGGGAQPGDTQPASAGDGAGLSAAPASAAAAPAVAPAPTVGSAPSPIGGSGGAGMGAPMGGMMPPMMGGPGRGGGGEDDKRLYEEKRLRLTTPPNAEPVKGRVEARESRTERRDKQS